MISRPTFALPHLADNSDNDAAARKRQYGRDLQEQVKDNLRRKDQEWRGNAPQQIVAKQLLGMPKGYPPVDPLKPAISSAILPLDVFQHVSGTDMMSVLRKWEQLFAGQAMQSASMVGNLNKRVAELESQLIEQSRDKQYLRERQDLLETAQGKQNRSYFEIESAIKTAERIREKESKDMSSDIENIRTTAASMLSKLADAVAAAQQKSADLHERLHEQNAQGQTLTARLNLLEQSTLGVHEDLKKVREHGESHARAAADAQASAGSRLASAESRLDRLERIAVPEAQGRADQLVQRHSAAVDDELSAMRRALQELQAKSAARDSAVEERLREIQGRLERLVASTAHSAEGVGADAGRVGALEQALAELAARGGERHAQLRGEVDALFEQLAVTVRETDARHSRLVEGLFERTGAQLAAQGEAVAGVEAVLRGERARLEELVRFEVEGRAGALDVVKAQLEARVDGALEEARRVREDLSTQVQAAGSRARAAGRAAKAVAAECEELRRSAAAAREPLASGLAAVEQDQRRMEDELRAQLQAGAAEVSQQLAAIRRQCESSGGGAQERADAVSLDLGQGLAALRGQVAVLDERVAGLMEAHAAARSRFEGDIKLLQGGQALAMDGLAAQGASLWGGLREARGELMQRMDAQRAQAEELHQRSLEAVRLAEARAAAQAAGLGARADAGERSVEALRRDVEERGREAQALVSGATAELLRSIEAKAAQAQAQALRFQGELDLLRRGQAEAGERAQRLAEEAEAWRAAAERRAEAAAEEGRRAVEAAMAEARRAGEALGEHRREAGARLARLDEKLVEDIRRILEAIQLHKEAHDRLKAGTDARLADLAREETEELERVWAELATVRELARRARAEGEGDVAGLQRLLQEASKGLQAEIDREAAAREEAEAAWRAAMEVEARARSEGEEGLRRGLGELSEARQRGDEELSGRLEAWRAEAQAGSGALAARVEALAEGTEGGLAALRERAEEEAREREAVDAAVDRLRALTNDALAALRAEDARLSAAVAATAAAAAVERAERGAAVGEVYRRMEVARQTESLLQQLQESEWAGRLAGLEGRLRAFADSGARSAVERARGMQEEIEKARKRDMADVAERLEVLREGVRAAEQRADEARRGLSGEIDGLALKVLSGGEAAAAEQARTLARMEEEHQRLRGEIELGGAATDALRAEMERGEAERRAEGERLARELSAEAEARAVESRRLEEALRKDLQAGEEAWRAAADGLSAALRAEESARGVECQRLEAELSAETAARAEREAALEAAAGAQAEALAGHGERIQALEEAATAARAGGAQTAEETAARLAEVAAALEQHRVELDAKAGRDQLETQAGEAEARAAGLQKELEGVLAAVKALEAGQESSARELEALEGRTGATAAAEAQRATDAAAERAAALEERLAGLESDCVRAAALAAVGERVDDTDARLRAVEADYVKAEVVAVVGERADAADRRLAALEGDWVKSEQLAALSGRVDAAEARLTAVEGDYVRGEELQGVREKAEATDTRLASVEADYAKREQVQGLEARVQAAEAEAARAAKLEVRVEQAEGFRGGDLKRVTAAEEQLKTLVKTVEGLKAKGGLTDEELSAMKPVQDLAAEVKRVEALLGPAAEAAAAEAKRLEGRVDELAAGKASVADVKFAADTAAGEMDTLKALRKADLDSLGGRIDALERASKTAAGAGAGAGAADDVSGLRAEVKKLEEGLAAVKKASDDAEGALHTRIDKLMVDELRKASNVQGQTLDKLDKKVRKLREAVKALEELAELHDPDGNDPPADAADAADAGAGGAGAVS